MSFHYRHRKAIIIITIVLFLFSGTFFFYKYKYKKTNKEESQQEEKVVIEKRNVKTSEKKEEKLLKVDIKGQIINPGIYSLEEESRVIDVINKAGGLTENADTTVLNLSKKIKDEMVIIVYSKDEVANFKEIKEKEKEVWEKCIKKDEESLQNDACINYEENKTITSGKININTANVEELKTLPGVGESKANNIINYRNKNGLFESIEDIKKVEGIGDNLYAQIEAFITTE